MPKLSGEAYRTIRLCVDSYNQGVLQGCFYSAGRREFKSLAQFLVGAEDLFDAINFPQSYTSKRSFVPRSDACPSESLSQGPQMGMLATFQIRLLFRQHASWQGSVTWVEGNSEQTFRSVLELILLIDSALGGCGEVPT